VSEYFSLTAEPTDDPDIMEIITSERLTNAGEEIYRSPEEGDVGSTIAQALFHAVDGIQALTIVDDTLIVQRAPGVVWEPLIDDIRDALRDFFL
jgi:hypothetical protein